MSKKRREMASKRRMGRRSFLMMGAGVLAGGVGLGFLWTRGDRTPALGEVTTEASGDRLETVGPGGLPSFARRGAKIQGAYRFAPENLDLLAFIPCYCGCDLAGHRNNADCYVKQKYPDGRITFNNHAAV
jgi:hypothetical protein